MLVISLLILLQIRVRVAPVHDVHPERKERMGHDDIYAVCID